MKIYFFTSYYANRQALLFEQGYQDRVCPDVFTGCGEDPAACEWSGRRTGVGKRTLCAWRNYAEEQILRYYRVPEPDTPLQFIKFRYSAEILERIGVNPALRQNLNNQNIGNVMKRLGFI